MAAGGVVRGPASRFQIPFFLFRGLIFRAPPDLVAAIYERVRRADGESPSWQEIVGAAQDLGIFTGMLHKLPQLVK